MKSIMTAVSPYLCGKITSGKCKILVRKSAPKGAPFKAYIYCTRTKKKWSLCDYEGAYQNSEGEIVYAQQRVIGEFVCRGIMQPFDSLRLMSKESCLTEEELITYSKGKPLYGWRITDLKIYDKPKKLNEFYKPCCSVITRPPRSWCYVETLRD